MNHHLALLALAYTSLTALLVLALLYSRLDWRLKLVLLLVAPALYYASYQGWKEAQGWPSNTALPARFLLHASVIEEPDLEQGTAGRIFIWASDLQGNRPAGSPRAYQVPYGKELHSSLEDALRNQRNGNIQIGGNRPQVKPGEVPKDLNRLGEAQNKLEFNSLPDPALPEK